MGEGYTEEEMLRGEVSDRRLPFKCVVVTVDEIGVVGGHARESRALQQQRSDLRRGTRHRAPRARSGWSVGRRADHSAASPSRCHILAQ